MSGTMRLKDQIIKHEAMRDVAFYVHSVRGPYGKDQKIVLKGEWLNLGFVESWPLNERQTIKIPKANLRRWLVCSNKHVKCLRYSEWLPCLR